MHTNTDKRQEKDTGLTILKMEKEDNPRTSKKELKRFGKHINPILRKQILYLTFIKRVKYKIDT